MSISPDQAHDRGLRKQEGLNRWFLDQANGDRELADRLRSEWFSELGRRSGSRRRAKRNAKIAAEVAALEASTGLRFLTVDEVAELACREVGH
jgi:hypothetical protein